MINIIDEFLDIEVNDEAAYLLITFFNTLQQEIEDRYFAQARRFVRAQEIERSSLWLEES